MIRSALRAALLSSAVLLGASEVPAYLVRRATNGTEITWNLSASASNVVAGKVTFYVDTAGVPNVTGQQFKDAVLGAVQSWEDVDGSVIAFMEDSSRSATQKNSSDRINRFGFTSGVLPPFAFASAFTSTSGNRITDVDVVMNPTVNSAGWSVQSPGSNQFADVQGVAAHEWGHGLGLDHISASHSTMYFAASLGAVSLRSLETDDAAAVIHAYPAANAGTDFASLRGTVDIAGAPDDRGVQVTALDFVTGLPAASALSLPDGSFDIEGLPAGVYRLVASPIGTQKRDGGVYSNYWGETVTTFFPAVRGQGGAGDGSTGVLIVEAGDDLTGLDLDLSTTDPSGEPNGTFSEATALPVGHSVGGRIANANDHDWFTFQGTEGQRVSIHIHAQQLGSDLDPRIYLRNDVRIAVAVSQDISQDYTGLDGADFDCSILDFEIPETGTWYIEVEAESSPDTSRPEDYFYVLSLLTSGGEPSPLTSTLTASPSILPADGASSSMLTFAPRSLTGGLLGDDLEVTMELVSDASSDGDLGGVTDHGDGTYSASLTAPSFGGGDVVRALVDGVPVSTATLSYVGSASAAQSDLSGTPRRLRPDGNSQGMVVFLPRDTQGLALGAGRVVLLTLDGNPVSSLGAVTDSGDGTYSALLTAGDVYEDPAIEVSTDGVSFEGTLSPVHIGFPVEEVLDEVIADLDGLLAGPSLPAKSVAKVQKARDILAAATGEPADVAKAIQKGVKQLEGAAKKGAPVADLASELAEACRQSALEAIEAAGPSADETKEMKALENAGTLAGVGDGNLDLGRRSTACGKYRSSLKQSAKIR